MNPIFFDFFDFYYFFFFLIFVDMKDERGIVMIHLLFYFIIVIYPCCCTPFTYIRVCVVCDLSLVP